MEAMTRPGLDGRGLEGCRQGDPQALRLLYETYKDRVFSLARRFTGDEWMARDLTQEIFLKLFARLPDFRGEAKFETWLFRIVANACIDEQRKRKRFVPLQPEIEMTYITEKRPQESSYIRHQLEKAVQAAIARLSPALRLPIVLRYVEGLSYGEIGEVLGCRAGTIAARLHRGHKILAKELAEFRGVMP